MDYFHGKNPALAALLQAEEPETIKMRRYLHEHPELSMQEKETSAYVQAEAKRLGLPFEIVGEYGVIVRIDGAKPGDYVMLRADMDGLPVEEEPQNLSCDRTCISKNPGVMHACGHDAHMAMLLSAMRVLAAYRDQFDGTILCCFEQGEEPIAGVHAMMKGLEKYPVKTCYGMHVYYAYDSGKLEVSAGPRMSAAYGFEITIHGKGGHGSRPDLCNSPILCGTQMINAWQNIWSVQLDRTKSVSLGIGQFNAGEAINVIPDTAFIGGSLRYFDRAAGPVAWEKFKKAAYTIAELNDCTIDFHEPYQPVGPVINDAEYSELAKEAVAEAVGEEHLMVGDPWYASESMSYYLAKYPGVFGLLGIRNPEKGTGANHHTSKFDVDEDAMKIGVASAVNYALHALKK